MYRAAIRAADPAAAIRECVHVDGRTIHVGKQRLTLARDARVHVLALGKAAPAMARALVTLDGLPAGGGVVATKVGHGRRVRGLHVMEAGHPLPDRAGVAAARTVLEYAEHHVAPADFVWVAVSGGSSAICCAPAPGLTLAHKRSLTQRLLRAGATIAELNTVRKHLSAIKGGQLSQALATAHVWTLAVSDVMGNDLGTIGSGPTAPDPTTFADAMRVLQHYHLWRDAPASARGYLLRGRRGAAPDTPGPGNPVFRRHRRTVIVDNTRAIAAAVAVAREAGFTPVVLGAEIGGETREVAVMHAAAARRVCVDGRPAPPPVALISGGETVVTLGARHGTGGRAQEFTLAFCEALGTVHRPVAVACVGTDGTDGPTDAAGAVGDDRTLARAAALGLPPPAVVLARHDAYPWFGPLGDLIQTGPTGTNVMDIRLVLIG